MTWLAGLRAVGAEVREGEIGPDPFQAACRMGLEELVSKHRDRPYRGGRQKFCIKVNDGARTGCAWLCPALADRVPTEFRLSFDGLRTMFARAKAG